MNEAPQAAHPDSASPSDLEEKLEKNVSSLDSETSSSVAVAKPALKRSLKARHIQMISIGGVIGSGLFIGTGNALATGGPLGLLLGYIFMGTVVWAVMVSLGELTAQYPVPGGFIGHSAQFVDPSFSFALGYQYWFDWVIALPSELAAFAVLIEYWNTSVNPAVWIAISMVVAFGINFTSTRTYGEFEFWFAIIKVITIVGLIILGVILASGGGPNHVATGFTFWSDPGPFVQYLGIQGSTGRFLGFFSVLIQAAYSYTGTEIVAIAAAEAANPRVTIPRAIKLVFIRVILFYVLGTFIIGLLVASDNPGLALSTGDVSSSPFVIAIENAGIPVLPSIINAAILTSAWSAASSDLYTSSRSLHALALSGNAPRFLKKITKSGLPIYCVVAGALLGFLSFLTVGSTAGVIFTNLSNLTALMGLIVWACICWTYIRFYNGMKAQNFDRRESLAYYSPFQPYTAYYGLFVNCFVIFFSGFSTFIDGQFSVATLLTTYLPTVLFPLSYYGHKFWKKTKTVSYQEMDLISGSSAPVDEIEEETKPKSFAGKIWQAIV